MKTVSPTAIILSANMDSENRFLNRVQEKGIDIKCARSVAEARNLLDNLKPDFAVLALDMQDDDSLVLLNHPALKDDAEIILTSYNDETDRVRDGISAGASYYFSRPSGENFLLALLGDIVAETSPPVDMPERSSNVTPIDQFGLLRGRSSPMRRLYRKLRRVAPTDTSVFIYGESGTGKELVAKTIHHFSDRKDCPFVALNCGAIPRDLIESELFGHEKGSFSGAVKRHEGYFERANSGTLFLDEITEMPLELQIKLLRVLETSRFRPIGAEQDIYSDVRILTASNRQPKTAVADNILREDLYFRIAGFPVLVPPLREREDDIKGLAQYFLNQLNEDNRTAKTIEEKALLELLEHSWPGNVRELRSVIEQAYIMANVHIASFDLPNIKETGVQSGVDDNLTINVSVGTTLQEMEYKLIQRTLDAYDGDKVQSAEALGVSLKTLYNRLNEYKKESEAKHFSV